MRLTLPKIRKFSFYAGVLLLTFATGWFARERIAGLGSSIPLLGNVSVDRTVPSNRSDVHFGLFWQVWDKLESDYYDKSKLNKEEMVLGAIKGMVSSLGDPYTAFLPPEEQKRTQEDLSGEFEGVGIEIGFRGARLTVIAPLPGSPAEKAGVRAGDYVVGIQDKDKKLDAGTGGMSLIDAVEAIRGKAGSKVTLIISREGTDKPLELAIARAKIEVPSVVLTFKGEKEDVAYLQLKRFGGNTDPEWVEAVEQIKNRNPRALILDLRNNPGGYLTGATDVASDFLTSGTVVIQEGVRGKKELKANGIPRLPSIKMVVLVNAGSASASEIVAGALKDNNRAKIVGQKTFGKGTIQEARPINGNSGLHITVAKWLTPNGTWVHEKGLEPDIEVEDKQDTTDIDEQLQKALELL